MGYARVEIQMVQKQLKCYPGVDAESKVRGEVIPKIQVDEGEILSSCLQRIDVTQDSQVGVEFYINTSDESWICKDRYAVLEVVLWHWRIIRCKGCTDAVLHTQGIDYL